MKDRYLFKAKRKDNKEWDYGYLYKNLKEECSLLSESIETGDIDIVEVIPETICQFTGLKDKNGVNIFENDEVYYYHKTFFKRKGKEVFDYKKEKCYVLWEKDFCGYILNKLPNKITKKSYIDILMKSGDEETIEVIKNIFDKENTDANITN